jgi:hypothetical protein
LRWTLPCHTPPATTPPGSVEDGHRGKTGDRNRKRTMTTENDIKKKKKKKKREQRRRSGPSGVTYKVSQEPGTRKDTKMDRRNREERTGPPVGIFKGSTASGALSIQVVEKSRRAAPLFCPEHHGQRRGGTQDQAQEEEEACEICGNLQGASGNCHPR